MSIVQTANAPAAIGPYVQAVQVPNMIFTSGQLGICPATGKLQEGVEEQAKQSLANIRAILEAAGYGMENIVKTTVFLKDLGDFGKVNAVYTEYIGEQFPARSCVQVAALPMGGLVEIEVIAYKA